MLVRVGFGTRGRIASHAAHAGPCGQAPGSQSVHAGDQVTTPTFDDDQRLAQRVEDLAIKQFVAQPGEIEPFR